MKQNKNQIGTILLLSTLLLVACGTDKINESTGTGTNQTTTEEISSESGDHDGMMHDESGEIQAGLEEAENPTYPVGNEATIQTDHMPGMQGATATVDSAKDTTIYMVTYTDTETGDTVENHKGMTEDELAPAE